MADDSHRNFTYLSDSHKGNALRKHLPALRAQLSKEGLSTMLRHLLADKVVTPLEKEGVERCGQRKVVQDVVNDFVTQFLLRKFECDFSKIVNAIRRAGLRQLAAELEEDAKMPLEEEEESDDGDFNYQINTAPYLRQPAKRFFKDIYKSIGVDWVDVGINLNIEYGELKKIEAEESLTDQRCMAMLHLWRRTQPRSAFVGYLANALTSANLQEIAEELDQLSNERFRHKIDA